MYTIGLDLDGVLYDWDQATRDIVREKWHVALPESRAWDYIKETIGHERWRTLWNNPETVRRMFSNGLPYPGALFAADELFDMADQLIILTSGPPETEDFKRGWLKLMEVHFDDFILVPANTEKTKADCDLYIDDAPHMAEDVVNNSDATLLLFDRPWNRRVAPHPRVIRCKDWQGVLLEANAFAA